MVRRHFRITPVALAVALAIALLVTAGCSKEQELQTVNEGLGLFHLKIPADWSSQVQRGLMAIYAAQEPPTTEQLTNLSIVIFTTRETTDTPVPEALAYVVERRAEQREWADTTISEPRETMIGGREGSVISVKGTDPQGVDFDALYYFVRTSGTEALVIAASPRDQWEEHRPSVESLIADEWYWHLPAGAEATATAQ